MQHFEVACGAAVHPKEQTTIICDTPQRRNHERLPVAFPD
jgi:hypothetical protein